MAICPFMSDAKNKVECDEDCMLYVNEELNWEVHGKQPWTGCSYWLNVMALEKLNSLSFVTRPATGSRTYLCVN